MVDKQVFINSELYEDSSFTQFTRPGIVPLNHPENLRNDPYVESRRLYGITNEGFRPYAPFRDNSYNIVVPEGKYFMLGDNRDQSLDSRMWGFVNRENILGKALIIHWSWELEDNNAPPVDWRNPFTVAANIGYNFIHFYERVNWERLGRLPQ